MKILGRCDRVDLPSLGIKNMHAKIDTGAFTSCLHCTRTEVVNGALEITLANEDHPAFNGRKFVFENFEQRYIKNSFGEGELRFVIITTVRILGEDVVTEFSLSNRGSLNFPMLLGRKVLRNRFLIDVKQKNLSYKEKRRLRKAKKDQKAKS